MSKTKEHYHNEIEAGMRDSSQKPAARSQHKIQWLNLPGYKGETWNPIIGCSKVSDGCKNCYAEKMAMRLQYMPQTTYYHDVLFFEPVNEQKGWAGNTSFVESQIDKPLKWKSPRVVFVCSMGDLFHESTSFDAIEAVFSVMADCDKHIYIVLTKRPERMVQFYEWKTAQAGVYWQPKDNVWIGVTAENQEQANVRIPHLVRIPAAVRFVSIEPMLSPVDISFIRSSSCSGYKPLESHPIGSPDRPFINWVICGGESGHHARPVHPDWVRSLQNQCQAAGVPFFFKQWGELLPGCQYESYKNTVLVNPKQFPSPHNQTKMNTYYKVGKHLSGNLLDGVKYEQYPIINL